MEDNIENYNPYCTVCDGCGEDGCCSAVHCDQSENCKYRRIYLRDLKFGYLMYHDLYDFLPNDEESKKKIDEIFHKNYDLIYKNEKD